MLIVPDFYTLNNFIVNKTTKKTRKTISSQRFKNSLPNLHIKNNEIVQQHKNRKILNFMASIFDNYVLIGR